METIPRQDKAFGSRSDKGWLDISSEENESQKSKMAATKPRKHIKATGPRDQCKHRNVISTGIGAPRPLAVFSWSQIPFGRRVQILQVYRPGSTRNVFIACMLTIFCYHFPRRASAVLSCSLHFVGTLAYANDLVLLAPTTSVMRKLLAIAYMKIMPANILQCT